MRLLDDQGKLFGRISLIDLGLTALLLLIAVPAVYFGWEILTASPRISSIEPMEIFITADKDASLTIHGKQFDKNSVARLGNTLLTTEAVTPRRLEARIPTQKVYPGAYLVTVTNLRGLSSKWAKPIRLDSIPLKVDDVQPRRFEIGKELRVIIRGKNFQKTISARIENVELTVRFISPTEIEAWGIIPANMKPGEYPIHVTNYYGQEDQSDVITLFRPVSSPIAPRPEEPDPKILIPSETVAVEVICSFQEPEMKVKRAMLKPGAVMVLENNIRPIAKIQNILGKTPAKDSNRKIVLATLVLLCSRYSSSDKAIFLRGGGLRGYPAEGEPVQIGSRLPFQFHTLDIEGTVLTEPIELKDKLEKYL